MKRWINLALVAAVVVSAAWISQQSRPTGKMARLSVAWLDQDWRKVQRAGIPAWNRRVHLKNPADQDFVGTVHVFVGEKPTTTFIEQSARSACQTIDLGPGEALATAVWSAENPAKEAHVIAFSCSTAELKRRLKLRQRYPLAKILWPLPYQVLQVGGYTAK